MWASWSEYIWKYSGNGFGTRFLNHLHFLNLSIIPSAPNNQLIWKCIETTFGQCTIQLPAPLNHLNFIGYPFVIAQLRSPHWKQLKRFQYGIGWSRFGNVWDLFEAICQTSNLVASVLIDFLCLRKPFILLNLPPRLVFRSTKLWWYIHRRKKKFDVLSIMRIIFLMKIF